MFNFYGLIIVALLMIPNIVYYIKNKNNFQKQANNNTLNIIENISRYATMVFMIFNTPFTWIGFYFSFANVVYLVVNAILVLSYFLIWIIMWKKNNIVRALLLSIIPSLIFIFCGVMIVSLPLILFAVIFAICHITISVKEVKKQEPSKHRKKQVWLTLVSLSVSLVFLVVGVFGGIIGYRLNQLNKLLSMSSVEMINFNVENSETKISIATIEEGIVTYHIYGKDGKENTIYDYEIGSLSKTYVGLLFSKLISEGRVQLQDSISDYLDLDENKYYPSIEKLLTHTSGYSGYYLESEIFWGKFDHSTSNDYYGISREKILNKVKSIDLQNQDYPFEYSNFGISVLGLVLEKIYNENFTDLMNNYIKTELGLQNTMVAKQSGNLSKYWKWKENDGYIPAGAIVSNIEDMAEYLQIYMSNSVTYADDTYLQPKQINASNPTNEKMNIQTNKIGYTWIIDDVNDFVWHNGGTTDFNSYMAFSKDRTKGVVVLGNLSPSSKISLTPIGAKIMIEMLSK